MREIKFRAWNKQTKEYIKDYAKIDFYGELKVMQFHGSAYGETCPDLILLQYTGLKDRNGKEIYEGDIMKSPEIDNQLPVVYKDIQESDDMTAPGIGFQFNTYPEEMEIIGNIYENPELGGGSK